MSELRKLLDIVAESSAGATGAGSVASVSQPMTTQRRVQEQTPEAPDVMEYGNWENSALTTSSKLKKSRSRAAKVVKSIYGEDHPDKKITESSRKKPVLENTEIDGMLEEQDLIINPAAMTRKISGLMGKQQDRTDHEVQMAKSDLFQACKNAAAIFDIIKDRSEQEGIEGWVQKKITTAEDYLSTVRDYLEGTKLESMDGVSPGTRMFASEQTQSSRDKICPQCGMQGCKCAPGTCKCTPKLGYPKSVAEDKSMSRAAKGNEKYGKDGMKALAKAGREGASEKKLDTIRAKYDHYNESVEENKEQGVAEGDTSTVYPNAQVIKTKKGRAVGEIYQDKSGWGCFHYRADTGYDGMDSREHALDQLKEMDYEYNPKSSVDEGQGVAKGPGHPAPGQATPTAAERKKSRDYQFTAAAKKARNAQDRKGVAEGLTKQARARKEAESVKTVIARLEQELKDPNPHLDKDDIRRRLETEKRRLELYRDVLDEQGVAEATDAPTKVGFNDIVVTKQSDGNYKIVRKGGAWMRLKKGEILTSQDVKELKANRAVFHVEQGVAEDYESKKTFVVVYYSPKTDRNVTTKVQANNESEVWDKLKSKNIEVISVKLHSAD